MPSQLSFYISEDGERNKKVLNSVTVRTSNQLVAQAPTSPDWERRFYQYYPLGDQKVVRIDTVARFVSVYSNSTRTVNQDVGAGDYPGQVRIAEVEIFGYPGELVVDDVTGDAVWRSVPYLEI